MTSEDLQGWDEDLEGERPPPIEDEEGLVALGDVLEAAPAAAKSAAVDAAAALTKAAPPSALDAERALLGAALTLGAEVVDGAAGEGLQPRDFYRPAHRTIWGIIEDLVGRQEPVDVLTVVEELRQDGQLDAVGGVAALTALTSLLPVASAAPAWARLVRDKAALRRLLDVLRSSVAAVYEQAAPAAAILDQVEAEVLAVRTKAGSSEHADRISILADLQHAGASEPLVVPGIRALAEALDGGHRAGDLVIVAGRPGMGKTALAAGSLAHADFMGVPGLFVNAEMSARQLLMREVAALTGYGTRVWRNPTRTQRAEIAMACATLGNRKVYLVDGAAKSAAEVAACVRRYVSRFGVKLVVVDYLQLLDFGKSKRDTDAAKIGESTRLLKQTALKLGIVIYVLSQLNRDVEKRPNKKPGMADLRDSGSIEADADLILFPFRPHTYWPDKAEHLVEPGLERAEVIIAKYRNGPTGSVDCAFRSAPMTFTDLGAP